MDRIKLKFRVLGAFFIVFFSTISVFAQHHNPDTTNIHVKASNTSVSGHPKTQDFDVMHHIADDYSFPIAGDYFIWLPVIVYDPGSGLDIFSSKNLYHPDETTHLIRGKYYYNHGKLYIVEGDQVKYDDKGHPIGKHAASITEVGSSNVFYDISITKVTFGLLLSVFLLLFIFISVARKYKKRGTDSAPRGFQNAIESIILFVKDDIAIPFIGEKKYRKFLPYLLTIFFFIWINNLLGLIPMFPGGANVSGNIAFTSVLALMSLILVFIFGRKTFWSHIFWFPGVNVGLKLFLAILEVVGVFSKPFALMIRLFANITAGHILIISIIGMTFMVKNLIGGVSIGIFTSLFSALMFILELLVGAIQAYIFTILTAQMIGAAVEEGHVHEAEHAPAH